MWVPMNFIMPVRPIPDSGIGSRLRRKDRIAQVPYRISVPIGGHPFVFQSRCDDIARLIQQRVLTAKRNELVRPKTQPPLTTEKNINRHTSSNVHFIPNRANQTRCQVALLFRLGRTHRTTVISFRLSVVSAAGLPCKPSAPFSAAAWQITP